MQRICSVPDGKWSGSKERSAYSFHRKELRVSGEIRAEKKIQNFFSGGSKNQTFCDVSIRGMKRPHEMMNPIFKCLFPHPR